MPLHCKFRHVFVWALRPRKDTEQSPRDGDTSKVMYGIQE